MALQPSELSVLHDDVDLDRDRALVERCQAGDSSAFGELYSRYYARVYRFCFRRLHDHEEAEDVAQDAFARAWRALPGFAGERRFYPWLTVIADNRCRDIQRRRVRSTPTADVDLAARQAAEPVSADTPEDMVITSVEGDLAVQALSRLSARHRNVLTLREGSGWTYQEIASHEGVEIRTVESLIWRARQALKREYASIASVNTVIGGVALGKWGVLRRAGGSIARRVHPLSGVLATSGGARGLAAGVALTSFAVVAAVVPGSSQPQHHPVASPTPAAPAGSGQVVPAGSWGASPVRVDGSLVGPVVSRGPGTPSGNAQGQSTSSASSPLAGPLATGANGGSDSGGTVPAMSAPNLPAAPNLQSILPGAGTVGPSLPAPPAGLTPPPGSSLTPPSSLPPPATSPTGTPVTIPPVPAGGTSVTGPITGLLGAP